MNTPKPNSKRGTHHDQTRLSKEDAMCLSVMGHFHFKVYLKDRPNTWEIKFSELCKWARISEIEIYAGETNVRNKPTDVIRRLMETLLTISYHIYMDNFHICPKLSDALANKSTMCTRTVRDNHKRLGMPKDLVSKNFRQGKLPFVGMEIVRFEMERQERDGIIVTSTQKPTDTVMHPSRNITKSKAKASTVCVNVYTKYMFAADHNNQLKSIYRSFIIIIIEMLQFKSM